MVLHIRQGTGLRFDSGSHAHLRISKVLEEGP
jgi:hypothetical protein